MRQMLLFNRTERFKIRVLFHVGVAVLVFVIFWLFLSWVAHIAFSLVQVGLVLQSFWIVKSCLSSSDSFSHGILGVLRVEIHTGFGLFKRFENERKVNSVWSRRFLVWWDVERFYSTAESSIFYFFNSFFLLLYKRIQISAFLARFPYLLFLAISITINFSLEFL